MQLWLDGLGGTRGGPIQLVCVDNARVARRFPAQAGTPTAIVGVATLARVGAASARAASVGRQFRPARPAGARGREAKITSAPAAERSPDGLLGRRG
jgi:Ser/Thr protein kinase RdoA (MazF antagonist)